MDTTWAQAKQISSFTRLILTALFASLLLCLKVVGTWLLSQQRTDPSVKIVITSYGQKIPRGSSLLHSTRGSNQSMKPTAHCGATSDCLPATPCRGFSLSR